MATKSARKRKPLLMKANEQYCLDFGQKDIGPTRCDVCGMLYQVGEKSDEIQHEKYHRDFDRGVRWCAKLERPKKHMDDGARILAVCSDDIRPTFDAVNKLLKMSEGEMSAGDDVLKYINRKNTKFLIYVDSSNYIVGYICVELIQKAYNLVDYETSRLSPEPVRADCGVLFLWVHKTFRRQKVGTWLVDIARANLKKDRIFPRTRVAVCDPTETAIPFFKAYLLNKRPVKIYQQE